MTRILVINTGGTISMQQSDDGSLAASAGDELPTLISELCSDLDVSAECTSLYDASGSIIATSDSSSINESHWLAIERTIREATQFDAYLILHGTDTMAYTASALAFACISITKPIILTGAQVPLSKPGSDGVQNIRISLEALNSIDRLPCIPMIAFGGLLLEGSRARKSSTHSAIGFDTPNAPIIAELFPSTRWLTNQQTIVQPQRKFACEADFSNNVIQLSLHPGLSAEMLKSMIVNSSIEGLIIRVFGTGTAPDALDLGNLLSECQDQTQGRFECAVIVTDVYDGSLDLSRYAAAKTLQADIIIDGKDMTPEAATTKLMWSLADARRAQARELMKVNLTGELTY